MGLRSTLTCHNLCKPLCRRTICRCGLQEDQFSEDASYASQSDDSWDDEEDGSIAGSAAGSVASATQADEQSGEADAR